MRHSFRLVAWLITAGVLMPAPAVAQGLSDPTRPPAALLSSGDAAVGVPGAPVLQSVIISPEFKAAIINGQMVRLGDGFGSARLVKVSESEVVLKEGGEEQVLKLYPGVKKSAPAGANSKRAAKAAQETGTKAPEPPSATGGAK